MGRSDSRRWNKCISTTEFPPRIHSVHIRTEVTRFASKKGIFDAYFCIGIFLVCLSFEFFKLIIRRITSIRAPEFFMSIVTSQDCPAYICSFSARCINEIFDLYLKPIGSIVFCYFVATITTLAIVSCTHETAVIRIPVYREWCYKHINKTRS